MISGQLCRIQIKNSLIKIKYLYDEFLVWIPIYRNDQNDMHDYLKLFTVDSENNDYNFDATYSNNVDSIQKCMNEVETGVYLIYL